MDNLRSADDIDLLGSSNSELQSHTKGLTDRARAYVMDVSTEKIKVRTHNKINIKAQICMKGKQFEKVDAFKYPGVSLTKH